MKELLAFTGLGVAAILALFFLITIGWAIIGWCVVAVVGLFTTVDVSGYLTYTAIGIVTHIIVAILK